MREGPYIAAEDSRLLRRVLEGQSGGACLEIGAGNGGGLAALSSRFRTVVGTDLVRPAMEDWKDGCDFVLADMATPFADATFDFVAFNPPYLPEEGSGDSAVDGGEDTRVPKAFLAEALRVVKKSGKVAFLLNQGASLQEFRELCREAGYEMRMVESERLFFETISVYEAESRR